MTTGGGLLGVRLLQRVRRFVKRASKDEDRGGLNEASNSNAYNGLSAAHPYTI